MTDCPNPTLVPMAPSLVTRLALTGIKDVDRKLKELRDDYVEYILANVQHPAQRFWHKDTPYTRAEAEQTADLDLARCQFFGWTMMFRHTAIIEHRNTLRRLIAASELVATGEDIWVDIATASMLARFN